jgi:hypothetical protein
MGITVRIKIGFTVTIRITRLKTTMTTGLTVVGKQDRQTYRRTTNMFFAYTTG